jgi:hypothetical protein
MSMQLHVEFLSDICDQLFTGGLQNLPSWFQGYHVMMAKLFQVSTPFDYDSSPAFPETV